MTAFSKPNPNIEIENGNELLAFRYELGLDIPTEIDHQKLIADILQRFKNSAEEDYENYPEDPMLPTRYYQLQYKLAEHLKKEMNYLAHFDIKFSQENMQEMLPYLEKILHFYKSWVDFNISHVSRNNWELGSLMNSKYERSGLKYFLDNLREFEPAKAMIEEFENSARIAEWEDLLIASPVGALELPEDSLRMPADHFWWQYNRN